MRKSTIVENTHERFIYTYRSEDNIYSSLQTKELKFVINQIVANMQSKMKEIYLLSKEEQLTNAEIVQLLTLAPQTVKNQIHQALSRICTELQKTTYNSFIFYFNLRNKLIANENNINNRQHKWYRFGYSQRIC